MLLPCFRLTCRSFNEIRNFSFSHTVTVFNAQFMLLIKCECVVIDDFSQVSFSQTNLRGKPAVAISPYLTNKLRSWEFKLQMV